jgi:hypothetical protein
MAALPNRALDIDLVIANAESPSSSRVCRWLTTELTQQLNGEEPTRYMATE